MQNKGIEWNGNEIVNNSLMSGDIRNVDIAQNAEIDMSKTKLSVNSDDKIILNENVDGLTEEIESVWGKPYLGFSIHE